MRSPCEVPVRMPICRGGDHQGWRPLVVRLPLLHGQQAYAAGLQLLLLKDGFFQGECKVHEPSDHDMVELGFPAGRLGYHLTESLTAVLGVSEPGP